MSFIACLEQDIRIVVSNAKAVAMSPPLIVLIVQLHVPTWTQSFHVHINKWHESCCDRYLRLKLQLAVSLDMYSVKQCHGRNFHSYPGSGVMLFQVQSK